MNNFKKVMALTTAAVLSIGMLAGCGAKKDAANTTADADENVTLDGTLVMGTNAAF